MPDHTALSFPPAKEGFQPNYELTPVQEEMKKKMLAKFSDPDYVLPGAENGKLTEDEQFWLVRLFRAFLSHHIYLYAMPVL
jgi:hypothetical protein